MTRVLAWAVIATLTTYLVFIGGAWAGVYVAEVRALSMAIAGVALLAWGIVAWKRPYWEPRTRMWPAIGVVLGSMAISTVFSREPRISAEYLGYTIVLAALYLLLVRLLADPFFRRRLVSLMGLLFVAIVAIDIGAVLAHWVEWWGLVGRFALPPLRPRFEGLTFLNPSAVLTMTALLAIPLAATLPNNRRGLTAGGAILIAIGLIALLSGSRAGWLALALTVASAGVAVIWLPSSRAALGRALTRVRATRRLQVGVMALLAGVLVAAVVVAPAVLRRLGDGGESTRFQLAVVAGRLFEQSPIVGTGLGTWVIQRTTETTAAEPDYYIPHAHNLEVQTLAEQGIVGAAAAVVLVLFIVRLLSAAVRGGDPLRRRWAWLATAGLAYFAFHQLLDFYANMPAALFAAIFPIAYLDATAPASEPVAREARRPPGYRAQGRGPNLWFAFVVSFASMGLIASESAALVASSAVGAANAGRWDAANAPAIRVAKADPTVSPYAYTAALVAARLGDHHRAIELLQTMVRRDDLPEAWLNLAAEAFEVGDLDGAAEALELALRLGQQRPAIAMAVGDLALRSGDSAMAVEAFSAALAKAPLLAGDPWWNGDAARSAAFETASAETERNAPPAALWQIYLGLGELEDARAATAKTDDASFRGLIVDGWEAAASGSDDGAQAAYEACLAEPQNLDRISWCSRLAAHRGEAIEASRFRTLAEFLLPGAGATSAVLRVAPTGETTTPVGVAYLWGAFTYRRFTPQDMLVPSLIHLVSK